MAPKNHAAFGDQSTQGEDEALEAALRHLEISTSRAEQALDQALADVRSALNDRSAQCSAAVVLSEQHYRQLQLQASRAPLADSSTLHLLLALSPAATPRSKAVIDADLAAERDW